MPRGARQEMQPPIASLHAPALPGHLITTLGRGMWHFSVMESPMVSTQVREKHPDEADRCSRLFYLGQILGVYCCGRTIQPTSPLATRSMGLRRCQDISLRPRPTGLHRELTTFQTNPTYEDTARLALRKVRSQRINRRRSS